MPNEKPPKTDWSFVEERNKKTEKPKTDWSWLNDVKKEKTETPEKKQAETYIDEMIALMKADIANKSKTIRQQNYERAKREIDKFRQEQDIKLTEDEIKKRDQELRRKLGLE